MAEKPEIADAGAKAVPVTDPAAIAVAPGSGPLGIPDVSANQAQVMNFCTMSTEEHRRYRASQDLR